MPDGPLAADVRDAADGLVDSLLAGGFDAEAVATIGASEDARLGWFVSDLLRFLQGSDRQDSLVSAFQNLTGIDPRELPGFAASPWKSATDALIAWDLPAPPGYRELKGRIFVEVEPGWAPFFDDVDAALIGDTCRGAVWRSTIDRSAMALHALAAASPRSMTPP